MAAPRPPGSAPAAGDPFRRLARRYLQAALAYFALGMLLGAAMIWFGNDNFQFLHSHMLLVGAGLFSAYGAGLRWIASGADAGPLPGVTPAMASGQFWLALLDAITECPKFRELPACARRHTDYAYWAFEPAMRSYSRFACRRRRIFASSAPLSAKT